MSGNRSGREREGLRRKCCVCWVQRKGEVVKDRDRGRLRIEERGGQGRRGYRRGWIRWERNYGHVPRPQSVSGVSAQEPG